MNAPTPALSCERLTKRYGSITALASVDLVVNPGECVALFGRNGAGKTTLLHAASSLIRSFDGHVRVFGVDVRNTDANARRSIGAVLHESCLYDDLSVVDNLRFYARLYRVEQPETRARELLGRFDLADRADAVVRELSRGMKQRLTIARACVHTPKLLLLDEPFTGLDEPACRAFATLLREFTNDGGAILMSTHDVERAFDVATRAVILERGIVTLDRSLSDFDATAFRHAYWHVLFTGATR